MNKGNLGKQIHLLERDLIKRKFKIDMERRNILKSFQAIHRTSGTSDAGIPPESRMDNIYAHSRHSKCGLRLSEKRLMEWKRRERELRRFMREMTIGSDLEVSPRFSRMNHRVKKRPKTTNDFGRDQEEQSAKIFRLYLENDKIQSKLEPRTKNSDALRLDKNHFIKIPCDAYIQDDLAQIVLKSDSTAEIEKLAGSRLSKSNSSASSLSREIPEEMDSNKQLRIERQRDSARRTLNRTRRTGSDRHNVPASTSEVVYKNASLPEGHNQIPITEERVSRSSKRTGYSPGTTSQKECFNRSTSSISKTQGLSPLADSTSPLAAASPEVPIDQKQTERAVSSGRPKSAKQQLDRILSSKLSANLNRTRGRGDSHADHTFGSRKGFLDMDERPASVSQRTRSLSRSGNRSSLSNRTIENFIGREKDGYITSASSRAISARTGGRSSRGSRSPSNRASYSPGFIADLFQDEDNCKSRLRRSEACQDSSDSTHSTVESIDERRNSARRTPRSSTPRSKRTLLYPTKHDCLKTSSPSTPRSLAVKKSKPHVHTNYLYAPYVLDSSDDESESGNSVFSSESDAEADSEDETDEQGIQEQRPVTSVVSLDDQSSGVARVISEFKEDSEAVTNPEEHHSEVEVVGAESSDNFQDTDAVSKGLMQRSTVQKQVRFSDNRNTKQGEGFTQPISNVDGILSQTVALQASPKTTPTFQTTASQTIWACGAEYPRAYEGDPRRHSLPKSAKYPTLKQNKAATAVIHPTKYLRKTQSDIFVEHPPNINSTRSLTIGSVFNVSIALSKLTRKKSLRDLVDLNNPDLREVVRQERLRDLEIKSQQLTEEANKFKL